MLSERPRGVPPAKLSTPRLNRQDYKQMADDAADFTPFSRDGER